MEEQGSWDDVVDLAERLGFTIGAFNHFERCIILMYRPFGDDDGVLVAVVNEFEPDGTTQGINRNYGLPLFNYEQARRYLESLPIGDRNVPRAI